MELEMANLTTLQRIKQLDAEREKILSEAKSSALTKAREAVAELNELGFAYALVEPGKPKKSKRRVKGGPCPVCAFETAPPHDRRAHRCQGEDKRPFTEEELGELGLLKVS